MSVRGLAVTAVVAGCAVGLPTWIMGHILDYTAAQVLRAGFAAPVGDPIRTVGWAAVRRGSAWQVSRVESHLELRCARIETRANGRSLSLLDDGERVWVLGEAGATVLQPSPRKVDWALLRENYQIRDAARAVIAGLEAAGIELVCKRTGRTSEVLWISAAPDLVLRRDTYDADGHLVLHSQVEEIRATTFDELQKRIDAPLAQLPKVASEAPLTDAAFAEQAGFAPARPQYVPRGYREVGLYARKCPRGRTYAERRYSDGLRVLSVYQRPGGGPGGGQGRGMGHRYGQARHTEAAGPVMIDEGEAKTVRVARGRSRIFVTGDLTQAELLRVANSLP
ncbi:MAG: hypothetical protein FJX74_05875 [Armatimonadetes bacterium]|nr:hypothetical protein [Armatimonadota bacterium]